MNDNKKEAGVTTCPSVKADCQSAEIRTRRHPERSDEVAESVDEVKTRFLATISHEMLTPLNIILGSTDLALEAGVRPGEVEAHLRRIASNAEILLRFVSDLLDVSKMETGRLDIETIPFKIRECLHGTLEPLAARARTKGLEYQMTIGESLPWRMLGDPGRLSQIVTNLVENAIKFTDHGRLHIDVSLMARGGWLEIRVIDTGSGIQPDVQPRIFGSFEQADSSTTRRRGGAGLGLSIVRSLVERLGGQVSVWSTAGAGADFRVILPCHGVADDEPLISEDSRQAESNHEHALKHHPRVLVAEDTDCNFEITQIILSRAGYSVTRAINGRAAVDAASGVELILMDIEMPEMDGLEATQLIRQAELLEGRKPIPILALTAHAVDGHRERCMAAGFTGYLKKPVRRESLVSAVGEALGKFRLLPWAADVGAP